MLAKKVEHAKEIWGKENRRPPQRMNSCTKKIEHLRRKHRAFSPEQAIAIGLNNATRAGVPLAPPAPGRVKEKTRRRGLSAYRKGTSVRTEAGSEILADSRISSKTRASQYSVA